MKAGDSFPMKGGDGPYSYSQNSFYQREAMEATKSMIIDSIFENLDIKNLPSSCTSNTIKIADFGCSMGPNTFLAIQCIIEAIHLKLEKTLHDDQNPKKALEFQVFFNDQNDNDFNTLFTTLPTPKDYFAAGVPGSFHSRVFPTATLHIAHSSYALHWLSRVPKAVVDKNSPIWNKGRVHYTGNVKVLEAYSDQFKRDMEVFFKARAQEIVSGGLMLLIVPGCEDGVLPCDTLVSMQFELFGSCLMDMVKMGKICEEKVDSFNLPMYHTSPMELRELIEANGSFNIVRMENFNPYVLEESLDFQMLVTHLRAAIEVLVAEHFGSDIIEDLFDRYHKKLAENEHLFDVKNWKEFMIFACLKRKNERNAF